MRRIAVFGLCLLVSCGSSAPRACTLADLSEEERALVVAQAERDVAMQLATARNGGDSEQDAENEYVGETDEQDDEPAEGANDAEAEAVELGPVLRVEATGPTRGPADALVTVVVFSDFQCPFCARHEHTLERLVAHYGADLRLVWRDNPLPFHDQARPTAVTARLVRESCGDAAYWTFHRTVFENATTTGNGGLERYATSACPAVRASLSRRGLAWRRTELLVDVDVGAAQRIGARGTPATFVNGHRVMGAQPYQQFVLVVDAALAEARALVANGTPRANVYAALMADAIADAPAEPTTTTTRRPDDDADRVYAIRFPQNVPTRGPANAPVEIHIYSDFQCPFCARVEPTIEQMRREFPNQVRWYWHDYPLPFHANAMPAAIAGRAVFSQRGNDAFWAFHDVLFQNQQELSAEALTRYAQRVRGLNMNAFQAMLRDDANEQTIRFEMNGVTEAGAQIGTPSFFINGRLLQGAQPVEAFRAAIQRALQERRPVPSVT